MFLCCVETMSLFRPKLDFLQIFKVAPKSGTGSLAKFRQKWLGENSPFL